MGAELMLWTEYISTREERDQHLFPRLLAGSEIFWTRKDMHEYHRFLGTCSQYGKLFLPPHTSITPRHAWDPPLIRQFISRWKRKRRVKRNSKMAGISFA
jgi:hexosaminidase